jgi:hypothetical protein
MGERLIRIADSTNPHNRFGAEIAFLPLPSRPVDQIASRRTADGHLRQPWLGSYGQL